MQWLYLITADNRPRVQLRILTTFEQQRISILSFVAVRLGEELCMRIDADVTSCDGHRVQALLYRNQDVLSIRAIPERDSTPVMAAYCVVCEEQNQIRLLQVLVGLGASINHVNDAVVAFQLEGSDSELEAIEQRLQRYWPVERLTVPASSRAINDPESKFPPGCASDGEGGRTACVGPQL